MAVPLLSLDQQNAALESQLTEAFQRVLHSGRFILGPEVENFENETAEALQVKHAIGVSSGTDAILMALMALDIGPGDEVICPSFTFFATAGCIARTGATPVFADSCPVCFNLSLKDFEKRITPRTKALIPVHLFGQAAEMEGIMELARSHNLAVIEDAAQSLGARYRERPVGTIGDFGTFSFFPSKNLGGFGDGGLLVTNDDALAATAVALRAHGASRKYFNERVGGNFRLDALQAALLRVKFPSLESYARARAGNAAYYIEKLSALPGVQQNDPALCDCPLSAQPSADPEARIILPVAYPHNTHIWNQFTLRVPSGRDALREHLQTSGIGSEIYYPRPMHRQECFANLEMDRDSLPVADRLAAESLSIPIYPELTQTQLAEVVDAIRTWLVSTQS